QRGGVIAFGTAIPVDGAEGSRGNLPRDARLEVPRGESGPGQHAWLQLARGISLAQRAHRRLLRSTSQGGCADKLSAPRQVRRRRGGVAAQGWQRDRGAAERARAAG